jgi:hypothetical protein
MSITAATISGGFTDPDATGLEPPGTTLNAVNEYSPFVDAITVDLENPDESGNAVPYISIKELACNVTINGTPTTLNEITGNGAVTLNGVVYAYPNTNSVSVLTVSVAIESGNTVGNIYITGNIQNAFEDKYWAYKDFVSQETTIAQSSSEVPNEDVGLHTYKPSFMRYVNIYFNVDVEYDETGNTTTTQSISIPKKVVNDWDINRLQMISLVNREEAYRSNNYPKVY